MERLGEGKGGWLRTEGRDSYLDEIINLKLYQINIWHFDGLKTHFPWIQFLKMRRGRARTTCWRELRGGAKALPRSWDPQFRGSSKSMGTSWFNNFSFRYLSSSIFPVFQLLSPELFAVLDCTVPHRDLSPTRAIGLVSISDYFGLLVPSKNYWFDFKSISFGQSLVKVERQQVNFWNLPGHNHHNIEL